MWRQASRTLTHLGRSQSVVAVPRTIRRVAGASAWPWGRGGAQGPCWLTRVPWLFSAVLPAMVGAREAAHWNPSANPVNRTPLCAPAARRPTYHASWLTRAPSAFCATGLPPRSRGRWADGPRQTMIGPLMSQVQLGWGQGRPFDSRLVVKLCCVYCLYCCIVHCRYSYLGPYLLHLLRARCTAPRPARGDCPTGASCP